MSPGQPAETTELLLVADEEPREPSRPPRLLLTNDDGIESPGIRLIAARLASTYDVIVVAPAQDRSGSGTGIGRFEPREGVKLAVADLDGIRAFTVDGPPGLAVMAGALGAFGPVPTLVVSGVNAGMNTGHSVIHSGTVGAALTARTFGADGLAISLAASDPWHWETAVAVAANVVDWLVRRPGGRMVLNVNVPAVPLSQITGAVWADLDSFGYFRVSTATESDERLQFEVAGRDSGRDPASDTAQCMAGYVTLTPLTAVEAEAFPPIKAEEICKLDGAG